MTGNPLLVLALAAAVSGVAGLAVAADATPRPYREFSEKPRIEDYDDYNAFLVDIMEYRRQRDAGALRPKRAAPTADNPTGVFVDESGRVTTGADRSLYVIDAPETLEQALQRARQLPHPHYTQPERFGRSTSFSFPLPPLEGTDMSAYEVEGMLQDLESLYVEVYEDEGAPALADRILGENPSNEDESRDKESFVDSQTIFQESFDPGTRTAVNSDGTVYELPLVLRNEVDFTIIRLTNLTVEIR